MKKKIIIGLIIFTLVFLFSGIYIVTSIQKDTTTLNNLIKLHQVEILREHLLTELKRVQTDLHFKNTRYSRGADTVVSHVRSMDKLMHSCFACHHNETVKALLFGLENTIEDYKNAISRVLTINADPIRLEREEQKAFAVGNTLLERVNSMISMANTRLEQKTNRTIKTINISKRILFLLLTIGPFLALLYGIFFVRSVSRPINILLEATKKIRDAHLNYRIKDDLQDEFGELAGSFNEMADSLELQYNKMQRAEQLTVYGEMAAGLAHEIKNPLAGIRAAMSYFSKELNLEDDDRMVFDKVISETRRIESMIKDLLSYARPRKPNFNLVDLNQLIDNVMELLAKYNSFSNDKEQKITIIKDFTDDLPGVEVDSMQQQQVLLNLFLNAADAMPEGGTLTVKTLYEPLQRNAKVIISDTGTGIDKADMKNIFKPFFTTKAKGTGLGLATTRRLIEQHGGDLRVNSVPNKGTSFTIIIPLKQAEEDLDHE